MRLYWLVWPQGCDGYLEKNYSIDFWSSPNTATTFFLGHPDLVLIGVDGASAFGADSTIASTSASCHFFLCVIGGAYSSRCQSTRGEH
jgi:hypothetical protein